MQVETERLVEICTANGYAKPVVYQGLFNPINRRAQEELFPTLKKHGIRFVALFAAAASKAAAVAVGMLLSRLGRARAGPAPSIREAPRQRTGPSSR